MDENKLTNLNEEIDTSKNPPKVTAVVTATGCSYHFVFTVTHQGSDIKNGELNFSLSPGFSAPSNITPSNANFIYTPSNGNGIWKFDELNSGAKTLTFDSLYIGAANVPVFDGSITFTADYRSGGSIVPITVYPTGNLTTTQCPTTNPCCEDCSTTTATDVAVHPCDDYVPAPTTVVVAPKGKKLSVLLDIPPVCDTRDVNVGVFVTEVFNLGNPATETEVPFAHKVIRRTSTGTTGTCADDRSCNCVDFMIDDETACSSIRNFRVRTQAHYVNAATDPLQQCQCSSCTTPLS